MGKRRRSLASVLWDSDTEQPAEYFDVIDHDERTRELQLENDILKSKVQQLSVELETVKLQRSTQSVVPKEMVPFNWEKLRATDQWVRRLKEDVVCLPRLQRELLPDLLSSKYCEGCIDFDLPDSSQVPARSHDMARM